MEIMMRASLAFDKYDLPNEQGRKPALGLGLGFQPHLKPSMRALRSSLRPMNTIWLMRGSFSPQGLSLGP